jgi:serine/threonine-protein kinase
LKTCPQCDTGYPDSHTTCPTHGLLLNEIRDLKPGMVIHQSYRIIRKLGQGGMGAVYLAQHTLMNEPQALKFLSSELSHDEAFTARFLREVRTLRQIRHKNVVDAGNLEPAEDGTLFFSMEYVDGPDLRAFLRDPQSHSAEDHAALKGHDFSRAANDPKEAPALAAEGSFSSISPISPNFSASSAGALPVPLALSIARQIAEGLGAAHAKGMVHRDIKPENILMARDAAAWLPKIADFGIVATKESSTAYTRTGGTLLTMAYAAPEQWRGTPAASLDGRTDLYALGGLLYEMLTGQTPFHAENYEGWSRQHQTTPPQPPSTLRPDLANWQGLDALLLRLLAKDRNDRPKDVDELLSLLDEVRLVPPKAHRETVAIEFGPHREHATKTSKPARHWGIWIGLLVSGLILAVLAVWIISQRSKQTKTNNEIAFNLSEAKPVNSAQHPSTPSPTLPADFKGWDEKPTKPDQQSILLVQCDLMCNWSLDGETKGHINAGGSAKAKIGLGQHLVVAVTEDGADQTKQVSEVKSSGQTVVSIELKPVRDVRLKAEQEARDNADHEARDKALREQQEKDRQVRQQAVREEAARPTWTDAATGLMWTKKDNGSDVTWQQATNYCRNLQLAGHSDWRLPTIDEYKSIYDANANVGGWFVKGNPLLSGWHWSSSQGNASEEACHFIFDYGVRFCYLHGYGYDVHALCVRRSGE